MDRSLACGPAQALLVNLVNLVKLVAMVIDGREATGFAAPFETSPR